jgi:hypothetical protein
MIVEEEVKRKNSELLRLKDNKDKLGRQIDSVAEEIAVARDQSLME